MVLFRILKKVVIMQTKVSKANEVFETYNFGNDIHVIDHSAWDTNDPKDYTKIVYFENSEESDESCRLSFHVKFDADIH